MCTAKTPLRWHRPCTRWHPRKPVMRWGYGRLVVRSRTCISSGGSIVPEAGWQAGAVIGRDLLEVDLRRKEKGFHFNFWQSLRGISEHCFESHFLIEHLKLFSRCINFQNSIGHSFWVRLRQKLINHFKCCKTSFRKHFWQLCRCHDREIQRFIFL